VGMDRNAAAVAAFAWIAANVDSSFERIPEDQRAEEPRTAPKR
jgi:hypothetical protein